MNRHDYLNRLESCLFCLAREERLAAIRYYEEYFEDAGPENEAAVIAELGEPEKLAQQIIAAAGAGGRPSAKETSPYGEFRSVKASLFNSSVRIELDREWRVALDYPDGRKAPKVRIADGTLFIEEERTNQSFKKLFSGSGFASGKVSITVPDIVFDRFHIETLNGSITVPELKLDTLECETVNGSISLDGTKCRVLNGKTVNGALKVEDAVATAEAKCSSVNGAVSMEGNFTGEIKASTVNGSVRLGFKQRAKEYDLDLTSVVGAIYVDGEKQARETRIVRGAPNHISADTVAGGVRIEFGV